METMNAIDMTEMLELILIVKEKYYFKVKQNYNFQVVTLNSNDFSSKVNEELRGHGKQLIDNILLPMISL